MFLCLFDHATRRRHFVDYPLESCFALKQFVILCVEQREAAFAKRTQREALILQDGRHIHRVHLELFAAPGIRVEAEQ